MALTGFVSFLCVFWSSIYPFQKEIFCFSGLLEFFETIIFAFLMSSSLLGFAFVFTVLGLSIPFFFLCKVPKNRFPFISLISFVLIFVLILYLLFNLELFKILINFLAVYVHTFCIFLPIFLLIPILCIFDSKKKFLIPNTFLTQNKYYKNFVKVFFYYFWFAYILLFLGFLILTLIFFN